MLLLTIIVCAALVGLDRLFKILAVQYLQPVGSVTVIPGFAGFQYVENDGAAFSMLAGKQLLLIIITGIVLLCVAYVLFFRRPKVRLEYVALMMIFAGGLGNWIDRVVYRYVVDYIEFLFMRFAIFNFADILVCVGFALLIIGLIREEVRTSKQRKSAEASGADPEVKPDGTD